MFALTEKNECPWPYRMAFERGTASISLLESAWHSLKGVSLFLWVAGLGIGSGVGVAGRGLAEAKFYIYDEKYLEN